MSAIQTHHSEADAHETGMRERSARGRFVAKLSAYALDALIVLGWGAFLIFVIYGYGLSHGTASF
ncbi:MAG: hypothetical protein HOK81_08050 [Rhodospirillaceae bacterium]|jgi:hypothetical protein|nr:hypothetical protein [Rhodospirillaceae bacterium]